MATSRDILARGTREGDLAAMTTSTHDIFSRAMAHHDDAVTFWLAERPIAVFGVISRWPGVGDLWGRVAPEAQTVPLRLVRACRDVLAAYATHYRMRRIAAWVGAEEAVCVRFAKLLGFDQEYRDAGSAPDGTDLLLFVRRWP